MEIGLSYAVQVARYACQCCEREWLDELPPIWMEYETWPTCCDTPANLLYPLVAIAG